MGQPLTAAVRFLSGEREPVRVATTGNIELSGLQTIDDVDLEVGDRVLVKDQTDASENGIRLASEGDWFRAPDASYTRAIEKGVTVTVREGTVNNGRDYRFTSESPRIGTDPITLLWSGPQAAQAAAEEAAEQAQAAANNQMVFDTEALASAATVPTAVNALRLNGSASEGDGLGGLYIDTDNGSSDTFTSNAGARTWYRAADVGQDRVKSFAIFDSNATERSLKDRLRQWPEVRDWDGVQDSLTHDSTVGLQRAFDESRSLYQSEDIAVRTTEPLILNRRGINFSGASKVATQIHADHDGIAIEVGNAVDTTTGYAPRCLLENFSIYGRPESTGGIKLHDKDGNPGWADASKAVTLRDIYISDIGNGPGLRINSWANSIERVEIAGDTLRGLIVGEQALTCTFTDLYITGCAKEGIIIGDTPARNETCNLLFNNAKVQQCGGAPGDAVILIQGVAGVFFNTLYLERNGEKDAQYDMNITDLAENVRVFDVTNRAPGASAIFRDAGLNTIISNVWNFGATDSIIRRVGAAALGSQYINLYQKSGALANGYIRDLATGAAFGNYIFTQNGVIQHARDYQKPKTATFTVDLSESGIVYHVQTASATAPVLPATAAVGHKFHIAAAGGGVCTLTPAVGATINGGASKALTANVLYTVVCTRNNGGSAAQWMTQA